MEKTQSPFKTSNPPASNLRYRINVPRGHFGESYDEERTPHYVLPDSNNMVMFLMQQLPNLYNTLLYTKVTTFRTYEPTEDPDWNRSGYFVEPMDKFFKSRDITISPAFSCICWLKSVAALQGDGGLGRNTKLTLKHAADLTTKFDVTVAKGAVQAVNKQLHCFYQYYATAIRRSGQDSHLAHTNPIVAGLMMLDHHFEYLDLASELIVVTSKLHFFGHLYNALVVEGFLSKLPFVEEILDIYDKMIFTPSRAAATRGAYYRTYLLSSSLKATALEATIRGDRTANGSGKMKRRPVFFLKDVSKIFRLLTKGDTSFLRAGSSRDLLTSAARICSEELFETRVLSRDMLILHENLTDIFSEMCNILGEDEARSVDDGQLVTLTVIRVLDAMQPSGEVAMSAMPGGNPNPWVGDRVNGRRFRAICTELAEVIQSKFAISPVDLERRYCVFSSFLAIEKTDDEASSIELPSTPVDALAEQVERMNVEHPSLNTAVNAGKKTKRCKKKNKKNKKGKAKGGQSTEAPRAIATGDDELAEKSKILKQLLAAVGAEIPANDGQIGVSVLEDSLRRSAAAVFNRLRDTSIPVHCKADDAHHASKFIVSLQG